MEVPMSRGKRIEDLILIELRENEFVSSNQFYESISRKLKKPNNTLTKDISDTLEKLFQKGKIIRYEIKYPNDFNIKTKVHKFPRYQYTLFK